MGPVCRQPPIPPLPQQSIRTVPQPRKHKQPAPTAPMVTQIIMLGACSAVLAAPTSIITIVLCCHWMRWHGNPVSLAAALFFFTLIASNLLIAIVSDAWAESVADAPSFRRFSRALFALHVHDKYSDLKKEPGVAPAAHGNDETGSLVGRAAVTVGLGLSSGGDWPAVLMLALPLSDRGKFCSPK